MRSARRTGSVPVISFLLLILATRGAPAGAAAQEGPPETPRKVEAPAPPVEWLPWSPQVFERATKEARGVLLTIVSRWCRPCLAADSEVYTDPGVRQLIAKQWIPVRVDRDDRPDIDTRYQLVTSSYTRGKTGLPITAFLFHTGEAMWADTYIPLEDHETHPGLRSLLASSEQLWRVRFAQARQNALFIQMAFDLEKQPIREAAPSPEVLSALMDATIARADHEHGGFGDPPRVTNSYNAELVLLASLRRRDEGLKAQALAALRAAIGGAGYDRLNGGFHRVARDESWSVAVWDKPLSVNATYLHVLIEASRATKEEDLASAARKTVDYILGTLGAPGGGFYAGQAPSRDPQDEAAYYTWKVDEVQAALGADDLRWAKALFGLRDEGELLLGLPPRFTLKDSLGVEEAARGSGKDPGELAAIARRITGALAAARGSHDAPPLVEARYLDSTALASSALLQAGAFLDRRDAVESALKAIDQILSANPEIGRGIPHRLDAAGVDRSPVLMADHAYFGEALLDAHEVTGEPRYFEAARKVSSAMRALFLDEEKGGFYDVVKDDVAPGYLRLRRKPMIDAITPSPEGEAARFFLRLAALSGDAALREAASGAIAWTITHLPAIDQKCSTVGLALDALLQPPLRITVGGSGEEASALLRAAFRLYEPGRVIERKGSPQATVSVCAGDRCREGIADPAMISSAIGELRSKAPRDAGSVAAP